MRKAVILVALLVPTRMLLWAALLIIGYTDRFSALSIGGLYIWTFGACGLVGLLLCLFDSSMNGQFGMRARIILLGAGLASAVAVSGSLLWWWSETAPTRHLDIRAWLALTVFPLFPAAIASWEIRRLARNIRRVGGAAGRSVWLLATTILVLPLFLAGGRALAEDVVIYWYGRGFLQVVVPAAERVAGGKPYCILADDGFVPGFAALDTDRILSRAIRRNLAHNPADQPHFRIVVGDTAYWWSFRDRRFYYIPGHEWSLAPAICPADRSAQD